MIKKIVILMVILVSVFAFNSNKTYAAEEEPDFDYSGKVITKTGTTIIALCAKTGTCYLVSKCAPGAAKPTATVVYHITKKELDNLVDAYEIDKKTGKVVKIVYEGETYLVEQTAEIYVETGLDDFEIKYNNSLKKEKMVKTINTLADKTLEKTADLYVKSGLDDAVTKTISVKENIINR